MINTIRKGSATIIIIENPSADEKALISRAEELRSESEKKKISFSKFKCNQPMQAKQVTLDDITTDDFFYVGDDVELPFD